VTGRRRAFVPDGVWHRSVAAARPAAVSGAKHKVIFQVSDNDPRKWNLALNNVKNVQDDLCPSRKSVVLDIVDVPLP
jgi:hypothetical protein